MRRQFSFRSYWANKQHWSLLLVNSVRFCSSSNSRNPSLPPPGSCVAHHCRPTPTDLNLDDLSSDLLARTWPQKADSLWQPAAVDSSRRQEVEQQQKSEVSVTISNVRRIMPPNPTVAAMVAATPPLATSSFHPTRTGAGSRKYEHSAENLLLCRALIDTNLGGKSRLSSISKSDLVVRDLVVFPDATLVVWGEGCTEADASFFARLVFGDSTSSSALIDSCSAGGGGTVSNKKQQKRRNVEIEFIQYRYVDTAAAAAAVKEKEGCAAADDEDADEVDKNQAPAAAAGDEKKLGAEGESSSKPSALSPIQVVDGVAIICAPDSPSMHLNLCYPTEHNSALLQQEESDNNSNSSSSSSSSNHLAKVDNDLPAAAVNEFDYTLEMLPVVMAIAQSTRVDAIDNFVVSRVARDVRTWQRHLAFRGRISRILLSSPSLRQSLRSVHIHLKSRPTLNQLRRCKAKLLGVTDEVTFALELEATPKLLRIANELQRFRSSYDNVADHFELEERLEALESRIEALNESLSYLHEERHSILTENLTILILVLIFLELVISLYQHQAEQKEDAATK